MHGPTHFSASLEAVWATWAAYMATFTSFLALVALEVTGCILVMTRTHSEPSSFVNLTCSYRVGKIGNIKIGNRKYYVRDVY